MDFKEFYDELKKENFKNLDLMRKKENLKYIFGFLLILLCIFIFFLMYVYRTILFLPIIIICAIIFAVYMLSIPESEYTAQQKNVIIDKILRIHSKDLVYEPKKGILKEEYTKVYDEKFDVYSSKDLIFGKLNEKNIQIALVNTYCEFYTNDNFHSTTVFNGIFEIMDISNNYDGIIIIEEKTYHKNILALELFSKRKNNKVKIKTNNNMFNKYFNLYVSNKDKIVNILSENLMNKMVELYKKYKLSFEITIMEDKLYMKIKKNNVLSVEPLDYALDKKSVKKDYDTYDFIFKVTEILSNIF